METLDGLALIEKSFATGAGTVSVTLVAWVAEVPVPVTVIGYEPVAVLVPTVNVRVELPPELTLAGLNEAVVPEGRPLAERLMVCGEPVVSAVEMVLVPVPPCTTETLLGLALIEKSL